MMVVSSKKRDGSVQTEDSPPVVCQVGMKRKALDRVEDGTENKEHPPALVTSEDAFKNNTENVKKPLSLPSISSSPNLSQSERYLPPESTTHDQGSSPRSETVKTAATTTKTTSSSKKSNAEWFDPEHGMEMRPLTESETTFLVYWNQAETWQILQKTGLLYSATKGYHYREGVVTDGELSMWSNLEDWAAYFVKHGIPNFDKLTNMADRFNLSWFVKSIHVDKAALRSAKCRLNGYSPIRALPTDDEIMSILRRLGFIIVTPNSTESLTEETEQHRKQQFRFYPPGSKQTYYQTLREVRRLIRRTAHLSDNSNFYLDSGGVDKAHKKRRRPPRQSSGTRDSALPPQVLLFLRVWAATSPDDLPAYSGSVVVDTQGDLSTATTTSTTTSTSTATCLTSSPKNSSSVLFFGGKVDESVNDCGDDDNAMRALNNPDHGDSSDSSCDSVLDNEDDEIPLDDQVFAMVALFNKKRYEERQKVKG